MNAFDVMPKPGQPPPVGKPLANRCTAPNREGDRCGRAAAFGFNVCNLHGGKAPQTIAADKRRLMEAAGDALTNIIHLANTAEDESVKLRANVVIVDRVPGLGPQATLNLAHEGAAAWTSWLTNEELEQVRGIREAAIARMDAGEPPVGEVREFDIPEQDKQIWLPKNERPSLPSADETIEAVFMDTPPES